MDFQQFLTGTNYRKKKLWKDEFGVIYFKW